MQAGTILYSIPINTVMKQKSVCIAGRQFILPVWMLLFCILFSNNAFSQTGEPIDIINADELQYNEQGTVPVRKLIGNVQLQQKEVTLYCDRADFYFEQNLLFKHQTNKQTE